MLAGLINYGYHVVLARLLGPTEYGSLTTLLNVTALMALPAAVSTLVYTRFGQRPKQMVRESWYLWSGGVLLWLIIVGLESPLASLLRVRASLLALFTLELVPSLAIGANTGILQHARRYWAVAVLIVLGNGFRVFAAAASSLTRYRLVALGGLEATAAGMTWVVSRALTQKRTGSKEHSSSGLVAGTALVAIANVVMAVADGMISKHNLTPYWAGEYNGLATIGHTVQYVSGSLSTVMLTSILADPAAQRRFGLITLLGYGGIGAGAELLFSQMGMPVVHIILGQHFLVVVGYLPTYGWGMIALGLLNICMMYAVATRTWTSLWVAGAGIVVWIWQLVETHAFAGLVIRTTRIMGATALVAVALQLVMAVRTDPKRQAKQVNPNK